MALNQIVTAVQKIFGTQNERELKSIAPIVEKINAFEPAMQKLSDEELKAKTPYFKQLLASGKTLDDILPEAFAVVREAGKRVLGMRHYDVQMVGGITLHRGRLAEMRTGEGKTLVATLPCYLNALSGKGVHVVTVNDYLARRDSQEMGQIYTFLGLSVGIIVHGLNDQERKRNYGCDISYGTNNEFGFDYLRDNMKFRLEDYVQRELNFAIVDEVDSILIDEARTPLIISGPTDDTTDLYYRIDHHILEDGGLQAEADYTVDEKSKTASLSQSGIDKMEKRLGITNLYDPVNIELLHHVNQGLRAHVLYQKDVEYVVRDGEIVIVDEFTGRLMPGRRWSDGLHQAIEAKEGCKIENENQTLATITFQNYFRMYNKLSGMTGTADTEAKEFNQIYKLNVTIVPTNQPMVRMDQQDLIYKSQMAKFKAIVQELKRLHEKGQPVLVGTVSVEKSEMLSQMLKKDGVRHNVLNAKQHEREADIVAQAGRKGAVTIATNMAGRGTDILLGGKAENLARMEIGALKSEATDEEIAEHEAKFKELLAKWKVKCAEERKEVAALGGLYILGTERHESRRIDNQLRGRAGRQGDAGESRFYLSFEDDLLRIFGQSDLLKRTVAAMEEEAPIEHPWTSRAIENAQKKVEGHNYDIRKHLLEYDDVMNQQRKVIYAWRKEVLASNNLREMVMGLTEEVAGNIGEEFFPNGRLKRGDDGSNVLNIREVNEAISTVLQFDAEVKESDISPYDNKGLAQLIMRIAESRYQQKESSMGLEIVRQIEKMVLLTTIDSLWKDHLLAMDHLRDGIGLQGYGQKDPLMAYKKEGFKFFQMMMDQITGDVVRKLFAVQIEGTDREATPPFIPSPFAQAPDPQAIQYNIAPDGSLIAANPGILGSEPMGQQPPAGAYPGQGQSGHQRTAAEFDLANFAKQPKKMTLSHAELGLGGQVVNPGNQAAPGGFDKAGRNDPCPCGSGKKFKKCHGT
jgi:preprotein translocase subunit SecA